MKKKKNFKEILTIVLVFCIALVGASFSIGSISKAFDKDAGVIIENVEKLIIGQEKNESSLGGTTNFDDISIDSLSVSGSVDVGRLTQGGGIYATSTTGVENETLLESTLINYNQLDITLTGDSTYTLTLPATSTLTTFIPNAGDISIFKIRSIGTAAKASTTIVAGTGIDLVENENGDVIIEGGNEAYLRFVRELDTDVTVSVDEYIAAD